MYDVIIVGAGASGLFSACNLRNLNKKISILLLEKTDKIGKKLSITGNGRCNLGNKNIDIKKYSSNSDLSRFKDILENNYYLNSLQSFGIFTKDENGLIYPYSNQASGVVKSFEKYIEKNNINIKYNYIVDKIDKSNDYYIINDDLKCKYLIIATGGMSYPKTGSTFDGLKLLKTYHNHHKIYPSLVPLISNYRYLKDLSGVRHNSRVKLFVDNELIKEEQGQVQFTDYGLSGICVFNLSRNVKEYIDNNKKVVLSLDLMPDLLDKDVISFIRRFGNYRIEEAFSNILNNKLSIVISKDLNIIGKKVKSIYDLDFILKKIHAFNFEIIDTKDYKVAQVTKGGLSLDEFTDYLESKKLKNLYVVGETLDCDGICGGYNLAWAFTTSLLATENIINNMNK